MIAETQLENVGADCKRGVLYYNRGTRFLPRLAVALRSLRQHYDGPATVAAEGGLPEWFNEILDRYKVDVVPMSREERYHLVVKSSLWRHTPYDETVFIDADTVIKGSIDPLFKAVRDKGFVVTNFNGWVTSGRKIRGRIRDWAKVDRQLSERAFSVKYAINTGVFGWRKGHKLLQETEQLSQRGLAAKCNRVMLDELAMQLLLPGHEHAVAGPEYNTGGSHGSPNGVVIMHYHGDKHVKPTKNCELWKQEFNALLEDFPHLAQQLEYGCGDGRLSEWRDEVRGRKIDLTIVTAVTPEYAAKAKANIERWMQTDGLKQQRFIVFVNGFKSAKERAFLNRKNITVVRWEYPFGARRERMLAAFVLGVARHVRTDYWMKLDADSAPKKDFFLWPDYHGATVTSHKWGYTKMKGDDGATRHWFNRLDDFFSPGKPLFNRTFDAVKDRRISHRRGSGNGIPMRYASFAHIERTEFTKRMADIIKANGGRMPIPSQDTLSWYCATLWKEPVKLMNMKEWFNPHA